jgi:glycolate oxidase FAD binding subunit
MLAFDPIDPAPLLGGAPGQATIGGTMIAGIAGSSRLTRGGPRDHLLGFEAVSGRGERFRAGAKVVKNVTGYDLPKLMAGSWGRLAALTELNLKVVPRPQLRQTLVLHGLDLPRGIEAMALALGSSAELSAAAYLPDWQGAPLTLLRLDGFPPSVIARMQVLDSALRDIALPEALGEAAGETLWQAVRDVATLPRDLPLWRIILAPSRAPALVAALPDAKWLFDWAGGLAWMAGNADPDELRAVVAKLDGHATLFRADAAKRATVPTLHPAPAPLAAIEARVRRAFDPAGIFETGRF